MNITRQLDAGGVCTLTFDRAASSANVFDRATLAELDAHLADLEKEAGLTGVILASAKPKIFIAGADLKEFVRAPDSEALGEIVDLGHRIFTRLSRLSVPSVAAIHGVCLGGGCEVALACDWRVASTAKVTKIGLPETQLGILPAWGGSVRLPALIGLPAALGLILPGRQIVGAQARKLCLVDELAHPEYLLEAARRQLARGKRPLHPRLFSGSAPFKALVAWQARRDVRAKTRGHYPAPLKAIEVCAAAQGRSLEAGFALEKAAFLELLETSECRNLMGIFFLQERAKKLSVPAPASAAPVRRVAVVGAGVMGAGIAQWVSARGLPVVLKDVAPEALAKGLRTAGSLYAEAVKRRVFTATEATAGQDRITPVHTDGPLEAVDLVIEAAVEKLEAKQAIFRALEARTRADTVLATNTSALSIDAIASGLTHPGRVVGIHFFNPVGRMQLVEIVHGRLTSPDALATAVQLAKAIGKLPVIVKDRPGFLVNRILLPYMTEAVRLFREGGNVGEIDRAMLDFGMPMGPLRLADEVGLDVAEHVAEDLAQRLPHPVPLDNTLTAMIAKGWFGKKSRRGFYVHGGKGVRERVNPDVNTARGAAAGRPFDVARARDRLVLIMINEAARCLDEGMVAAPEDVDFAMILGTGWAPFRGGPLRHADTLGSGEIVRRLETLAREVAPHFEPCEYLRAMARAGGKFYRSDNSVRP